MPSTSLKYHSFAPKQDDDASEDGDFEYKDLEDGKLKSYYHNFLVAFKYVWASTFKQKKNFLIGFTAVWIVVLSISYVLILHIQFGWF